MADFPDLEKRLDEQIKRIKDEFTKIRSGRAHAGVIEDIMVDYFNSKQPIKSLGSIGSLGPQTLIVEPWDNNALEAIARAITKAQNGLQAVVDGDKVRIPFPSLSKERREEFIRFALQKAEEGKIVFRQIRDDELRELKRQEKDKEIGKDDFFRAKEKLEKIFKEYAEKIDKMKGDKEEELSTI